MSATPQVDGSETRHGRVSVATLIHELQKLDPSLTVVVAAGIGYEKPTLRTTFVRPVLVEQRYLYERNGREVVLLAPVNS